MPREKKQPNTRASMVRAVERAYSSVAVLEDAAWDICPTAAGELLEAVGALERAIQYLKGEEPE